MAIEITNKDSFLGGKDIICATIIVFGLLQITVQQGLWIWYMRTLKQSGNLPVCAGRYNNLDSELTPVDSTSVGRFRANNDNFSFLPGVCLFPSPFGSRKRGEELEDEELEIERRLSR